jgi:hypothetical protein
MPHGIWGRYVFGLTLEPFVSLYFHTFHKCIHMMPLHVSALIGRCLGFGGLPPPSRMEIFNFSREPIRRLSGVFHRSHEVVVSAHR